jgi:hypothetical protein
MECQNFNYFKLPSIYIPNSEIYSSVSSTLGIINLKIFINLTDKPDLTLNYQFYCL